MTPSAEEQREMVTLLRDVRERVVRIETKVEHIQTHGSQKAQAAHELAEDACAAVERLDAHQTWQWRTLGGTVFATVFNAIFTPFQ